MKITTNAMLQLIAGAFFLQSTLACPPVENYFPPEHGNQTHGALRKRGFPLSTSLGTSGLWDNGIITYCFADDASKKKLRKVIPKAWDLWLTAGASPSLQMKEGPSSVCSSTNADVRAGYLLISYNSNKKLSTTLGADGGPGKDGPTSELDDTDDFASGSGVSNIAHELGHAWGLGHEHQRPSLWSTAFGGNARDDTAVFDLQCDNLKDYDTFNAQLSAATMKQICHFQSQTKRHTLKVDDKDQVFSAFDILPVNDGSMKDPGRPGVVDWDSIMIYGSTCAGKGSTTGLATTITRINQEANGYTGTTFGYNLAPSKDDVDTLNNLYHDIISEKQQKKTSRFPLWAKSSSMHGLFGKRNKSDSCS